VVFIGAAVTKLDALPSWTALVARFPVAPPLRRAITFALPGIELLIGVAVVIAPQAGLALCAAVLAIFAAVLFVLLPQLRGADCHCFGAIASARVDLRLIVRNLVLGAVAGAASGISWTRGDPGAVPVLEFAAVALAAVLAVLLTSYRALPKLDHIGELIPTEGDS
jgi:hypothetical protein